MLLGAGITRCGISRAAAFDPLTVFFFFPSFPVVPGHYALPPRSCRVEAARTSVRRVRPAIQQWKTCHADVLRRAENEIAIPVLAEFEFRPSLWRGGNPAGPFPRLPNAPGRQSNTFARNFALRLFRADRLPAASSLK